MDIEQAFGSDRTDHSDLEKIAQWITYEGKLLLQLKKELNSRKEKLAATKEKLAETMKARGLKSVAFDSGLTPLRKVARKFHIKSGVSSEDICNWFIENGLGDCVKRSVGWQTMQSTLDTRLDQGEEIPTDLVEKTERDSLTMNGKTKFLADKGVVVRATQAIIRGDKVAIEHP